jgi:dephospho-CoA kinase
VDNSEKKPIIGILGGIGSGDADKIAHEILEQPDVREQVLCLFGEGILEDSGKIDRSSLADIVFADGEKLSTLNNIIHPLVLARVEQLISRYRKDPATRAIVLDMPLLVEIGWEKMCDRLIFVECREQLRLKRAKKIGFFEKNRVKIRENFQISLDKKVRIAENTVENNSDLSDLARQVADIFSFVVDNR